MSSDDPRGIIELGNINIKCLIFRINNGDASEILSTAVTRSEGIHNGVIVNLTNASQVIRSCLSTSEKKLKFHLKKLTWLSNNLNFYVLNFQSIEKLMDPKFIKMILNFY